MNDKVTIDPKVIAEDRVLQIKNKQEQDKHLKGYIYDSLVYRYQMALYKASLKDAEDIMIRQRISKIQAEAKARSNYNRDFVKF